jgi:predicted RNA binding protein YcfA (HicA-like mRNA interferase family)
LARRNQCFQILFISLSVLLIHLNILSVIWQSHFLPNCKPFRQFGLLLGRAQASFPKIHDILANVDKLLTVEVRICDKWAPRPPWPTARAAVDGLLNQWYHNPRQMPRKIRELVSDLKKAGFVLVHGGKGSHRKFRHSRIPGAVILSGADNDDARHYQEKQVRNAIWEALNES